MHSQTTQKWITLNGHHLYHPAEDRRSRAICRYTAECSTWAGPSAQATSQATLGFWEASLPAPTRLVETAARVKAEQSLQASPGS